MINHLYIRFEHCPLPQQSTLNAVIIISRESYPLFWTVGWNRGATHGRSIQKVPYLVSEIYILFPFCSLSTGRPQGNRGGIWCRLGLANFRGMLRRLEKLASNKSSDASILSQAVEVPDHGKSDLMGCFGKVHVRMGVYLLWLEKKSHACFRAYVGSKACINILHAANCCAYLHFYAHYICISCVFGCVTATFDCVYACQNQGREGGEGGEKKSDKNDKRLLSVTDGYLEFCCKAVLKWTDFSLMSKKAGR